MKTISECLFVLFNYQSRAGMFNESGYYFRENSKIGFFSFLWLRSCQRKILSVWLLVPVLPSSGTFCFIISLAKKTTKHWCEYVQYSHAHAWACKQRLFPPPTLSVCSKLGVFRGVGSAWLGFSSTWTAILQEWWAFFVFELKSDFIYQYVNFNIPSPLTRERITHLLRKEWLAFSTEHNFVY